MQTIYADLIGILVLVLIIGVIALTNRGLKYINAKNESLAVDIAIKATENVVYNIVQSFNQTTINDLKEKAEDGKLTEGEISTVMSSVIETVKISLSDSVIAELESVYKDLDQYLRDLIERSVLEAKKANLTTS
jgi:hypothetical protein